VDDYEMTYTSLATGYHNPVWLSFCGAIIKKNVTLQSKEDKGPSQNEQKEEKHDDNILTKEIESWKDFEYALREDNRLLFSKMLS
jgi:hypothetical protein